MIDPYPISALGDRYKLNSKQAIYDRLKALNITPVSRGKISVTQLDYLDELDKHLTGGGSFASFTEKKSMVNRPVESAFYPLDELELQQRKVDGADDPSIKLCKKNIETVTDLRQTSQFSEWQLSAALSHLVNLIAPDPLAHYEQLQRACVFGWLLTTGELATILGVKPRGEVFTRGSFVFSSAGKIGNQKAWRICKSTSKETAQKT